MIRILVALCGVGSTVYADTNKNATDPVIVLTAHQATKINQSVSYILDATNTLTIANILQGGHAWQRPDAENMVFGLPTTTVWVHLRLQNSFPSSQQAHLEFNPVFLEYITAYDALGREVATSGSKRPPSDLRAFPTIALEVEEGVHDYYIAIRSRGNSLALSLRSESEQTKKNVFDLAIFCILIGGLLALMVYHSFLFLTYRNRSYLLYSLFVASTILFTASFTSYHAHLLPAVILGFPVDFWWSAISAPILFLCIYLFSAELLGLFPRSMRWSRGNRLNLVLLSFPLVNCACVALVFITDDPFLLAPIRFSALIEILTLMAVATYIWAKNRSNSIALYYVVSWVPFLLGAILVVSWLSGAVDHHDVYPWSLPMGALVQSLLLSFAAGQRMKLLTREKMSEQQAKLKVMSELETQVKNLKRRDKVITAFASSDIVGELDQGNDPLSYSPRKVEKCIAFLDMHDFTTFSESHSELESYKILNDYFEIINRCTYEGGGTVDKIIGDAVMIVFDQPTDCLTSIVNLRRSLSANNRVRVARNQSPIKFGMGVSYGMMLSANFGSSHKLDRTLVGDAVNVASRLEAITRTFAVDVLCSKEFTEHYPHYHYFRPAGYVMLKGRRKKSLVYEMFEHNLPHVVEWKISTKPYIENVIELELDGKYDEAIAVLQSLVDRCPAHSYKEGAIMDPTLESMIAAIEEKMRQLGLAVHSRSNKSQQIFPMKRAS